MPVAPFLESPTLEDASSSRAAGIPVRRWPLLLRVAFRACFTYFALTMWIWLDELAVRPTRPMQLIYPIFARHIVDFLARHLLHTSQVFQPNSFRDTHYLYLLLLGCLLLTAVVTIVWSIIDRRRLEYERLYGLFRIFLRYSLAYMTLLYGMDKVIKLQFPAPGLNRLIENYGDSSPMVLMWTFMGYSTAYTIFCGLAEVASGVLVLFRRTTLLGALLCTAVMANVTVMDFSYDVSVKLYSANLLLIAIMLVLPDIRRLLYFFFNEPTPGGSPILFPREPRWRGGYLLLKTLVVLYLIVPLTLRNLHGFREVGPEAPKPPLYGLYQVKTFRSNGVIVPALTDNAFRWRFVAVDSLRTVYVKHMDDSMTKYNLQYDPKTHRAVLDAADPIKTTATLTAEADGSQLHLTGISDGQPLDIELMKDDPRRFLLVNRGFHWINETSFFK